MRIVRTTFRRHSKRPQHTNRFNHLADDPAELFPFSGRNIIQPAALFFDPQLFQHQVQHAVALQGAAVPLFVVAVTRVAGQDYNTVGTFYKCGKNELRIDPAAAHDPDDLDIGRIRLLHPARLVGAGIGAPVAEKSDDFGLKDLPLLSFQDSFNLGHDLLIGKMVAGNGSGRTGGHTGAAAVTEHGVDTGRIVLRVERNGTIRTDR